MAGTLTTPAIATPGGEPRQPEPIRAPASSGARAKSRHLKTSERLYIVPGEQQWEVWAGADAASARFVKNVERPTEVEKPEAFALALPAGEVVTLPIWLATTDRSLIPEMVAMQCEKRGVLNRSRGESVWDYSPVTQMSNESLLLAQLLPPTLSPEVCVETVEHFDLYSRFVHLPDNALVIWRELGTLTAVLTRNKTVVYSATLGDAQINEGVAARLFCLLSLAQAERWITTSLEVVLRGTFTSEDETALSSVLGLRTRREERPSPWIPATTSKLIPAQVRQALDKRRKRIQTQRLVVLFASAYLAAIALWGGYVGWLALQARTIAARVNVTAPEVSQLRSTAIRWQELQPAINPDYFPVETLFRCFNSLPKEGLRLTGFVLRDNRIRLSGESTGSNSFRMVNKLLDDLKANPDLKEFSWNMPQPQMRDATCKFQIEGTRATPHP